MFFLYSHLKEHTLIARFHLLPSSEYLGGSMDDGKKEKKRKDISGKVGKEMNDRRDE